MPFTSDLINITLRYTFLGQKCQTAQAYSPAGAVFATVNATQVGEAWWNDVKEAWRGLFVNVVGALSLDSVLVEEIGGSLSFGEYAIPVDESTGTRDPGDATAYLPSYVAVGCRLTVPTRATRPGQKRFPGLLDTDVFENVVQATFLGLCEGLALKYDSVITLGAPVALGTLAPRVVHYSAPGVVGASQDVDGHVINGYVTSQVSRRFGHGA